MTITPVYADRIEQMTQGVGASLAGPGSSPTGQARAGLDASRFDPSRLTDHEQMLDAQRTCIPCKLCGGQAEITDAGTGRGYYIRCGNSVDFRRSTGCLIGDRRLSGWAYNVRDWWNQLHAPWEGEAAIAARLAALQKAVRDVLPIGNDQLPDDRVIAIYVRMDELRALRSLASRPGGPA